MKWFSLDWFTSKLTKKEEKEEKVEVEINDTYGKHYEKMKLVNNVLTIILLDGTIVTKHDMTIEDFDKVKGITSLKEFKRFILSDIDYKDFEKQLEMEQVRSYLKLIESCPLFVQKEGSFYFDDIHRSLPKLLVIELGKLLHEFEGSLDRLQGSERFIALKRFWIKCCLNPNVDTANRLFDFLSNKNMKIDEFGNFYAYRRVERVSKDDSYSHAVSNAYTKVKAVWKKRPSTYVMYTSDDFEGYKITEASKVCSVKFQDRNHTVVGNLDELYKNLKEDEGNLYTSNYTGKEEYRVGTTISMPRYEGDDDNRQTCSKGFHGCDPTLYDYKSYGDTAALMIVNPMDVLAIPFGEEGKFRTCKWFFAMTIDMQEELILRNEDFDVTKLGELFEYENSKTLADDVFRGFGEEVERHTFNLPQITSKELKNNIYLLDKMNDVLRRRVEEIV